MRALAFADDGLLVTGSKIGMRTSITNVEEKGKSIGLQLNTAKSCTLSMVPVGKVKGISKETFQTKAGWLKATKAQGRWKYLGITFSPEGLTSMSDDVTSLLGRIASAPLKHQQRLHILRARCSTPSS